MRNLSFCLLLLLPATQLAAEPVDYIPRGEVEVRLMTIVAPERVQELTSRLQAAIGEHREWFAEQVQNASPGEPLPWDARLGLTEGEYAEFLETSSQMSLQEAGREKLNFEWLADSKVVLRAEGAIEELNGIVIDLKSDAVSTETYGVLDSRSAVNNTDPDSPTGRWTGVQWKREEGSGDGASITGVAASLALGRLASTGDGILYFDAKKAEQGQLVAQSSLILFYSLP